jgi:hypothetical protein
MTSRRALRDTLGIASRTCELLDQPREVFAGANRQAAYSLVEHGPVVVDEGYRRECMITLHGLHDTRTSRACAIDDYVLRAAGLMDQKILRDVSAADEIEPAECTVDDGEPERHGRHPAEPGAGGQYDGRTRGDLGPGHQQSHAEIANDGVVEAQ